MRTIQKFEVGIKGFVVKDRKLLVLLDPNEDRWELPGGRIDQGEENLPQTEILNREIAEELGKDFKIEIGPLAATWIRECGNDRYVFLVGRICNYLNGEIKISPEHVDYKWVDENECKKLNFLSGFTLAIQEFWKFFESKKE